METKRHLKLVTDNTPGEATEASTEANALTASDAELYELLGRAMPHVLRVAFEKQAQTQAKLAAAEQREKRERKGRFQSDSARHELAKSLAEKQRQYPDNSPHWRWLSDLNGIIDETFAGQRRPITRAGLNNWFSENKSKARVRCRRIGRHWQFDLASMKANWEQAGLPPLPWHELRRAFAYDAMGELI